jgi:O-antigen ligase
MIPLISITFFLIYMNVPVVLVSAHGMPRPLALLIPMLLVVPVAYRVLIRGEALRFPGLIIAALLMLACHTLSALLSDRPDLAMETVFSWLIEGVLLAFLIVNALRNRTEVFVAARALVAAGALMGLVVLLQQILGPTEHGMAGFGQIDMQDLGQSQHRLAGPIGEKNRFAQVLAVLIPVTAGLALTAPARLRLVYWMAILLICCGVALSFSRGAIVALVVVIPFALIFGFFRLRYLAIAAIFGAVLFAAIPYLAHRVSSIGDVALQSLGLAAGGFRNADGASRGRVTEMQAAGLLFLEHPLLGAGPGMAPVFYPEYAVLVGGKVRQGPRRSHNIYLQLAAETGVVGLLAFLGTLWVVLYSLDQGRRSTQYSDRELWGLLCGLELAVLILMATSFFLHAAYVRYFWLLLGLAVAAAALPHPPMQREFLTISKRNSQRRLEPQA